MQTAPSAATTARSRMIQVCAGSRKGVLTMATRLDKIMEPILKEKCEEAFQAGYKKGLEDGWKNKSLAYENQIEFLKKLLDNK